MGEGELSDEEDSSLNERKDDLGLGLRLGMGLGGRKSERVEKSARSERTVRI